MLPRQVHSVVSLIACNEPARFGFEQCAMCHIAEAGAEEGGGEKKENGEGISGMQKESLAWPVLVLLVLLLPLSFILSADFYSPSASLASVSFLQLIMQDETRGKWWEALRLSSCPRSTPPPTTLLANSAETRSSLCNCVQSGALPMDTRNKVVWDGSGLDDRLANKHTGPRSAAVCATAAAEPLDTAGPLPNKPLADVEFRPLPTAGPGHGATAAAEQNQITTQSALRL